MELIDKNKIDFYTIETDDSSGNEIIEVAFKEDIERLPGVKAISLDKVKKAIEVIKNRTTYDGIYIDRADVLEILDKLIESEDR